MSIEWRAAVFEYGSVVDTHVLCRAPIYAVWTSIEYVRVYYIYIGNRSAQKYLDILVNFLIIELIFLITTN